MAILDNAPLPHIEQHLSSVASPSSYSRPRSRLLYIKTDITVVPEIESAVERIVIWTDTTGARLGGLINGAGIARGGQVSRVAEHKNIGLKASIR